MKMFSGQDFERLFGVKSLAVKYFLEKESGGGILVRLKRGLYALKTDWPAEEEVANRLYRPSYISFEYALAYYNIWPEMVYAVTCATTKATRTFEIEDKKMTYLKIKRQAYTGYRLVKEEGKSFLIAEPEKALVDYLYFVSLGKKSINDRLNTKSLERKKMVSYGKLFGRKKLMSLIKEI